MHNPSLSQACWLLRLTSYGFFLFAAIWWTAVSSVIDLPATLLLDTLAWPIDGSHDELNQNARWLSAVGSSLTVGLAGMLLWVVIPELEQGNVRVVRGAKHSIWAWYLVDSVGCILAGVVSNAIFNTVFLLMLLVPLWLAERSQRETE